MTYLCDNGWLVYLFTVYPSIQTFLHWDFADIDIHIWDDPAQRIIPNNFQVKSGARAALCEAVSRFQGYRHIPPRLTDVVLLGDITLVSWSGRDKYDVATGKSVWEYADGEGYKYPSVKWSPVSKERGYRVIISSFWILHYCKK